MTDLTTLLAAVTKDGWWVPLETYLHYYPGESAEAVYKRRSRGHWKDGIHCNFPKGGKLWVNLIAINQWAAKDASRPE